MSPIIEAGKFIKKWGANVGGIITERQFVMDVLAFAERISGQSVEEPSETDQPGDQRRRKTLKALNALSKARLVSLAYDALIECDRAEPFRNSIRKLRNEINCRIEHGAESGGHLEYVQAELDKILKEAQ